jgi:hypothetical protein
LWNPHTGWINGAADAEFIAMARSAMPKLLSAVQNVLALHTAGNIYPLDDDGYPDQSKEPITTFCEECTSDDTVRLIEDCEWTEDYASVSWPCPTVKALTDALGAEPSNTGSKQ